jgi:hypothetical protein
MIARLLLSLPKLFSLALFLCLCVANVPAQDPEMRAPPQPDFPSEPPPDPDSLPPPPPLEWEPLTASAAEEESSAAPLPEALFVQSEPVTTLAPPPEPVTALFAGRESDPVEFEIATPRIEIWRSGAESPESPMEIRGELQTALIASGNPIWIRLLFDPSLTGASVTVTVGEGVIIQPAESVVQIGPTGECLFLVDLDAKQTEGTEISFDSSQITTGLRLTAVPVEIVNELVQ